MLFYKNMESYSDRIGKFNQMLTDTADHVAAVQDAATKWDNSDPVGSALTIAGAASGGVGGLAGSVAGIQHFKDFKTMYKNVTQRLGKSKTDGTSGRGGGDQGGGDGTTPRTNSNDPGGSSRAANSADNDGSAPNPTADGTASRPAASGGNNSASAQGDGLGDRINDMDSNPFPTTEANSINRTIEAKASANGIDKDDLNSRLATSGRGTDELNSINKFPEGDLKVDAQKDYLNFKNNVANDAIDRANSGRPPASGYDGQGNPTGEAPGPSLPQNTTPDVMRTPANASSAPDGTTGGGAVAPDPNVAPATSASGDLTTAVDDGSNLASGGMQNMISRGQQALASLRPAQVPAQGGGSVGGLANQAPDVSQGANAASRLQQGLADQTAGARSAMAHPNTGGGQPSNAGAAQGSGTDGGGSSVGGGGEAPTGGAQPASTGTIAADAEDGGTLIGRATNAASTASKTAGAISDVADVGDAVDLMAGMSGPLAPIVGLVGGLISLGTTIAGLFHKKPPPKKEAPPPPSTMSIGANLSQNQSSGVGIY